MEEEHCEDYGVRSGCSLMHPSCDTDLQALGTSTNLELCYHSRDVMALSSLQRQTHEQRKETTERSTRSSGNILIRIIPVHDLLFMIIFKRTVVSLGIIWTFGTS